MGSLFLSSLFFCRALPPCPRMASDSMIARMMELFSRACSCRRCRSSSLPSFFIFALHAAVLLLFCSQYRFCFCANALPPPSVHHRPWLRTAPDPMIQKTWERRSEYQVIESMKYFLDGMARIMQPQYVATPQDILHIRIRSSGECGGGAGCARTYYYGGP